MVEVVVGRGLGEEVALAKLLVRGKASRQVRRGIDEELERRLPRIFAERLGDDGREVAARAVSAHGYARRIQAELQGGREDGAGRGDGVERSGGELVLRREPIIHRDDHDARFGSEEAANAVVRVDGAEREAAAVEVDEARRPSAAHALRRVDARAKLALRALHAGIAHLHPGSHVEVERRPRFDP